MNLPTKIPTVLGLLLVVVIVGVVAIANQSYFQTVSRASGSIVPTNVTVANLSDSMFTVAWATANPATGAIEVASGGLTNRVIFDDQDTGTQGQYTTHIVTMRGATPDTTYEVTILSNGKTSLDGNKPYEVHTPAALSGASGNLSPAYGTIVLPDKSPVKGALVTLTLDGSQTMTAISKPSGTWLIPLNLIRTQDLTSYLPVTDRMTVNITVSGNGQTTTAVTDTLNDSPVPNMMLGQTYDFRHASAQAPGTPLALANPTPTGPSPLSPAAVLGASTVKAANIVALTIPAQGAALPTALPLIQGTGIPAKTVSIVLGITNPTGGSAVVGPDGLWSYTPVKPLGVGAESVTITTQNVNNKPVAITHLFTILESGSQVLGDATASATPTPTITLAPIITATATPTPVSTLAAQTPPTSGDTLPTIIFLLIGVGLMLGGGVAFIQ